MSDFEILKYYKQFIDALHDKIYTILKKKENQKTQGGPKPLWGERG